MMGPRLDRIRTDRLILRRAQADDLAPLHAIMADEEVMRFWSTEPHSSLEQTRAWLQSMISADPAISDDFMIDYEGMLVGKLGAWRLPEVGFLLSREHWGLGLVSEALEAFSHYVAGRGAVFLTADVDPLNTRCLAVLTRAGFQVTGEAKGTYRVGNRVCDSVYLRRQL